MHPSSDRENQILIINDEIFFPPQRFVSISGLTQ